MMDISSMSALLTAINQQCLDSVKYMLSKRTVIESHQVIILLIYIGFIFKITFFLVSPQPRILFH